MRSWRIPFINIQLHSSRFFHVISAELLTGSRFRLNFIKVASANAFSQSLPIIVAPVLTRLYSPADFGSVALFSALLGIVSSMATMRIDWLVSNVAIDKKAANVFLIGIAHVVLVALAIFLFNLSGLYRKISFVNWHIIDNYLWLLPVALIGSGMQLMLAAWFVRVADLSPVATARVRQSIGGSVLNLLGGVLSFGAVGLVVSATASSWVGVVSLGRRARQTLGACLGQITRVSIMAGFKEISHKYLISGSTGLVNIFGLLLPTLFISAYFSPVELGWYALMQRLATGPVGILTVAVSQSFWAEARHLVNFDALALRHLFVKTTKRLSLISIPVALACLAGPLYIGAVFGLEKWAGAGAILAVLTPFVLTQIMVSTLSPIIVICGEGNWLFVWDVLRTIMMVIIFVLSHLFAISFIWTVGAFSMLMAVMYVVLFFKNLRLLNSLTRSNNQSS